ncbi:MAG: cache domain-containing protein, partial [Brevundimonas sp.]
MKTLKIRGRVNLLTLGAIVGLLLVLALALIELSSVMRSDIADRTRKTVEIAHSIVVDFHKREQSGEMTRQQAQTAALTAISALRYGEDDYFWVNDMQPRMLMHPFKPELNGKDISGNTDADGVFMFQEMVKVVQASGEGFVDYRWSKPGEEEPAPKISYVKGFAPWGWVVGSGVYVDQIDAAVFDAAVSQGSIALLIVLGVGILSWLLCRSIVLPLSGLTARMRSLADGDTDAPIPSRERSDEIGQMSQALQVFRDAAVAKAKTDAEKAKADADQTFVVEMLSDKLASVSEGDLTAEITAEFPGSYAALKSNF